MVQLSRPFEVALEPGRILAIFPSQLRQGGHPFQFRFQNIPVPGFLHERHNACLDAVFYLVHVREPGEENGSDVRPCARSFEQQLRAFSPGHLEIGYDCPAAVRIVCQNYERFIDRTCASELQASFFQPFFKLPLERNQNFFFIVDE